MLRTLGIRDIRSQLRVVPNPPDLVRRSIVSRRVRRGSILGATVHYNGPAISFFGNPQAELRHVIVTDTLNHIQRIQADSLQYHLVVLSDGTIYQTRDFDLIAWHCANPWGNEHTLAIHLPLGGSQEATLVQITALSRLLDALQVQYGFPRANVKGHSEYSKTLCPGTLQAFVVNYREQQNRLGLPVRGEPSISLDIFTEVLRSGNSPALSVATDLYGICVAESINPAVALAFFYHESKLGTVGLVKDYNLRNWGAVRTPEDPSLGSELSIPGAGHFAVYTSWQNGLLDWCKRLKGPKYAGSGLRTVEQILPKYAPSSDGNRPQTYIATVRALVARWEGLRQTTLQFACIRPSNLRTRPRTTNEDGTPVPVLRAFTIGDRITVDTIKADGDVQTISGDNRWLHLASGEGFTWAGNWKRIE